jgi:hypothetical protein
MPEFTRLPRKLGMHFHEPKMLVLLRVDESGRVREHKDWIIEENGQ